MYKDKDKQREAQRNWVRQKRIDKQGSTVIPNDIKLEMAKHEIMSSGAVVVPDIIKPKRGKDIKTFADLSPDVQQTIDMMAMIDGKIDKTIKANRTAIAINYQHQFPDRYYPQDAVISGPAVTGKPGDADYNGVCTDAWRAERGR